MDNLHVFLLFALLLLAANMIQNFKRMDRRHSLPGHEARPLVSVLVPARNEEQNIEACLRSLLGSEYHPIEIIVLDDHSEDRTYEIVRRICTGNPNLRVIRGEELPPRWNGKNWACHQLAQAAKGEWFLFTDADTRHNPGSISTALATALENRSDFVTALPGLINKTWAEKIILPVIHFAFAVLMPYLLADYSGKSRAAVGIGPFMFIRRKHYFACGGFESVKADILDDMALARRVKQCGGGISVIDGSSLVNVRFYTGFRQIWKGFSKNTFQAIGGSPYVLLFLSLACYFLFVYPYIRLAEALAYGQSILYPLLQVTVLCFIKISLSRRFKTSLAYGLLHPLTILLVLVIIFNSCRISVFQRKIEWKERLYPVE